MNAQLMDRAVVLELGSGHLRAGSPHFFPSENEPFVVTEAAGTVGPAGADENGAAVGPSSSGRTVHPIVRGEIRDWEVLETLMDRVLYDRMGWARGAEGALLVAEPPFTSRDDRERLCQLAFETFNAPAFFAADQAVLALYCVGRLSGLVVDVGLDKTDISSVVDGLLLHSAARRLPYGGRQLTQHLAQLLAQRPGGGGGPVQLSFDAAEALKKAIFRVAESSAAVPPTKAAVAAAAGAGVPAGVAGAGAAAAPPTTHTLPDGQTIAVGGEGAALGEALLDPTLLGLDLPPLAAAAQAVVSALEDKAQRRAVGEAVVVCGGGSAGGFASGLPPRLLREMRTLAPAGQALTLAAVPEYLPPQALPCAAWMGGAVLGRYVFQQGNAAQQAVSKADYDEHGPAVVHRRCS
eukprot:scaffold18.g2053.t1